MRSFALHWQILAGMLIGAAAGVILNAGYSSRTTRLPEALLPSGIQELVFRDTTGCVEILVREADGSQRTLLVDPTRRTAGSYRSLDELQQAEPQLVRLFLHHGRSIARRYGDAAQRAGGLFLRMLQMVAVPLIVTSLTTGVLGLGDPQRLGRMFTLTLSYYLSTSLLAIFTGIMMVNLIKPGLRGGGAAPAGGDAPNVSGDLPEVLMQQVEALIPANPIAALAEGQFLSIIAFSLLFAIFALLCGGRTAQVLREFFAAGFEVMMRMTMAIIRLAPLGVLFLMLYVTATQGLEVFQSLAWYMLAVVCGLALHGLVTLPAIVWFFGRRSPRQFAAAMSPALLTAFSSASSNGTLPLTLACAEQRAGISNRVGSFVLPLGATINMDGTALYEAVAVLFIGQLYNGFSLPLSQQLIVALTALLASIGAAGIPHAGLVMMVIILQAVGLPLEMQGIILAVDRILDMCRTSVNVWSDACGCAVIARLDAVGQDAGSAETATG